MSALIKASSHQSNQVGQHRYKASPAYAYLNSLDSELSRGTMRSNLAQVVRIILNLEPTIEVMPEEFPWERIDHFEFDAIIKEMSKRDYAPETIKTFMAAIRGVLKKAFLMNIITADQLERVKLVDRPKGSRLGKGRCLELFESKALLSSCEETPIGIRDRAMISLMFGCGLRRTELVSIKFSDYDPKRAVIKILGKGNKEREAYLTDSGIKALEKWIADIRGNGPGAMFVRIRKNDDLAPFTKLDANRKTVPNGLSSQAIYKILSEKQEAIGLEKFSPHDLRRTLATKLLDLGEDLSTVRDILGHASVNTTQMYDMRSKKRLKEAVNRTGF
jgi:integrase/recombinase XerD